MIRLVAFVVLSELAVLVGAAATLAHRHSIFAGFRAGSVSRAYRRAQQPHPPSAAVALDCSCQPLATARVNHPPEPSVQSLAPLLPEVNAHPTSDKRLVRKCTCGAFAQHIGLMTERAICVGCNRYLMRVGSQYAFIGVVQRRRYTGEDAWS